jgi:hypothetical protein
MAEKRSKTISYRRAVWFTPKGDGNLEDLLRTVHKQFKTVAERKVKRSGGQVLKGLHFHPKRGGGFFMHVVAETPGDHASTLSALHDSAEVGSVSTAPAPAGSEFMDGDIFLYVRGNDLSICATSLREGGLATYCRDLFTKAGLGDASTLFEIQRVAKADRMKMINAEGVKEIELHATMYEATAKYIQRKTKASGALAAVGDHLKAVFGKDLDASSEHVKIGVSIKTDYRGSEGKVLGASQMKNIARDVVESDADYTIITRKGQRINNNDIAVREKVDIERLGKSVDFKAAWQELEKFHDRLVEAGVADE